MFEKTLADIVKGIRASKRDTALYISQCIAEIKTEINSSDMYVKANALQKLTFLQMMGYGMSWASFATIEVMSSPRFAHKRIGYLAASQGFTQDTDVILLTTNSLKKELKGASAGGMTGVYEAGLAINCVANIVTEELAQDLLPELTNLTSHPQPYLRKKAILCLFKLFVKYPQGLRLTFAQVQQCLSDPNPAVASCAVNVITELSDKNPKNYLHLAPAFFDLLTTSSNNWMLIKVVKLLGSLVTEEPRLARKLLDPLAQIVRNTPAKSLMYEAVHAITQCLPYCRKSDGSMPAIVPEIVDLCAQTLRDFVEEKDQNLKYLGLVGFSSLMQSHPKVLSAPTYRPLILACLSDEDVTIRTRALGLLPGMASRKNLMELVKQLLQHVEYASGDYKLDLVAKIVEMCSGEKYAMLQNFSWYLDTLFQLGHMRGLETHSELLRSQVLNVALRVLPVRAYAVKKSIEILLEGEDVIGVRNNAGGDNGRGRHIMPEILPSLAWIVGEYADLFSEALSIDANAVYTYNSESTGPYHSLIQAITAPTTSMKLPPSTQKVYVQSALKVFAAATASSQVSDAELEACCMTLSTNLLVFMQSTNVEVQERAFTLHALIQSLNLTVNVPRSFKPALVNLEEDDSSGDDAEGNLLDIAGSALPPIKPLKSSNAQQIPALDGLASRCRNASQSLNFLLKASPMKPTGAKAQRKKHSAPIGVDIDISAPVDVSVFASLIEEENLHRRKSKSSMESINFTQQKPLLDTITSMDMHNSEILGSTDAPSTSLLQDDFLQSFSDQQPETNTIVSQQRTSAKDPFYLTSSPAILDSEQSPTVQNRFGAIELGDLDSDEEAGEEMQRKRHKKKKKQKKQKAGQIPALPEDLGFNQAFGAITVYGSDDEEDNEVLGQAANRKPAGREFDGLAKVDLTMPLREDEVMPERKHRVVPERPLDIPTQPLDETKQHKVKKKKKESKKSKKRSKEGPGDVGDLLNLGLSSSVPVPESALIPSSDEGLIATPQPGTMIQNERNVIGSAFDDLLGLETSTPAMPSSTSTSDVFGIGNTSPASPSPTLVTTEVMPWIRASIKASHATGSPVVDWAKVQMNFQVYKAKSDIGPSILIRVENRMETSILKSLVLRLKDHGDLSIGDVAPGSSGQTTRIGPFSNIAVDSALEMKGSLITSECSVPVKVTVPVSVHFSPVLGLKLEDVAQEFSSSQWSSNTAKIDIRTTGRVEKIKTILGTFLFMEEVEPGSSGPLHGTFAGKSSSGAQIRLLVKVKQSGVKVDVKCNNPALGKALSSDLKRLIL